MSFRVGNVGSLFVPFVLTRGVDVMGWLAGGLAGWRVWAGSIRVISCLGDSCLFLSIICAQSGLNCVESCHTT